MVKMRYREFLAELESIVSDTIEAAESHQYSDEALDWLREGWSEVIEFAREKLGGRFATDVRDQLDLLVDAAERIEEKDRRLEQQELKSAPECPHCERRPCECDDAFDGVGSWHSYSGLWSEDDDVSDQQQTRSPSHSLNHTLRGSGISPSARWPTA